MSIFISCYILFYVKFSSWSKLKITVDCYFLHIGLVFSFVSHGVEINLSLSLSLSLSLFCDMTFSLFFLQKSLKKEHFLWKLLNIEKDIAKINEDLEAENKSREDVIQEQESCEREASKAKKEQAKYLKEITQFEKKISDKNNKLDKNVSSFWLLFIFLYF